MDIKKDDQPMEDIGRSVFETLKANIRGKQGIIDMHTDIEVDLRAEISRLNKIIKEMGGKQC